ncbi:hypothetical protein Tco_0299192 [Tanacetum coccineum]
MRKHQMTMSRMQLNSKFVNNMLPEWGRFVTAGKLNSGLRDSNYDQLYAYLKQTLMGPCQCNNAWGGGAAGYRGAQNRVGNANQASGTDNPLMEDVLMVCDAFVSDVDEAPQIRLCSWLILSSAEILFMMPAVAIL